jgi:hypothetical protein
MIEFMVASGLDVNETADGRNALSEAVSNGHFEVAKWLLDRGAKIIPVNETTSGALFAAVGSGSIEVVRLLIEHGADVNGRFGSPPETALSHAIVLGRTEIAELLRSRGAVLPLHISTSPQLSKKQEILDRVEAQLGSINPSALSGVVSDIIPLSIHLVPPGPGRDFLTLFTTGMSNQPVPLPDDWADYRYVELLLFLPSAWPSTWEGLLVPPYDWAVKILRWIAYTTFERQRWIYSEGVIPHEDPPQPIGHGLAFDSFLLYNAVNLMEHFKTRDGQLMRFYRVVPLLPEEREFLDSHELFELQEQLPELGLPGVVHPNRQSFLTRE